MLFPLKKKDSVVFPRGPRMNQSRIIPRHLILNLIRRMSRTLFYKYELREQCTSQYILNNITHYIRLSAWLFNEEEQGTTDGTKRTSRSLHTYELLHNYLMKKNREQFVVVHTSLFVGYTFVCAVHRYKEQRCLLIY